MVPNFLVVSVVLEKLAQFQASRFGWSRLFRFWQCSNLKAIFLPIGSIVDGACPRSNAHGPGGGVYDKVL